MHGEAMQYGLYTYELEEVLEEWLLFRLSRQLPVPVADGIDLVVREVA